MGAIPEQTDVVVVGSGATGLAAALTVAEGGAAVMVFEKQRSLGGTSNFFQGTFAVESDMQRERYVDYTRDQAFKNTMDYSHWMANPRLVRAIVDESGPTIGWLQEQGVVFMDATINMPDAPLTYHTVKGRGEAVVKTLVDQAKAKGAKIFPAVPVVALLKEGGRISGVIAEEDGEEIEVAAKAVVIASGGFANNKEWIKKYTGYELGVNLMPVGNTGKTGDGIRMAWEVGAAEEGIRTIEMFRVAPVGDEFAMGCNLEQAAAQPDLWVTARGMRFCDESIGFYDTPVGNAQARHKADGYTFSILDDSILERLETYGLDKGVGIEFPPGTKLTELRREIESAISNGSQEVFVADSLEDLAQQIGIDVPVLAATVDEYNRFCAQGRDELFAKEGRYLRPLLGPRFYAVRGRAVFLGTMGGLRVDEKLEVLDKKDDPIPGLYAGGFDAGGMYGDSYPIKSSSGLASAFALNSGRIAGRNALEYLAR